MYVEDKTKIELVLEFLFTYMLWLFVIVGSIPATICCLIGFFVKRLTGSSLTIKSFFNSFRDDYYLLALCIGIAVVAGFLYWL